MNKKSVQKRQISQNNPSEIEPYKGKDELVKTQLFGVGIINATEENILEFILKSVTKKEKPYYVVTPNPEMIVLAQKNPEFKKILNHAKIASNDGIGLGIAASFLGKNLAPRTTGVDLLENLCKRVADWPITVSFLGGWGNVAENTVECLKQRYPGLKVGFASEELPVNQKIPATDILFVAFGAPKQEIWMAKHVGNIPATVMIGVGGAFDYISGKVPRAPRFIRALGLEWLFRLVMQPWRVKRQLALLEFIWMVMKEKFGW